MDWWLAALLQFGALLVTLYFYFTQKYAYWTKKGVPGPKPSISQIGNIFEIMGNPPDLIEVELFKKYGTKYGYYNGFEPILTIAEPKLIKQVMVKDFHLFVERRQLGTYHELFNHNLFFADAEEWKRIRTITTPAFSSGKLRSMQKLMNKCIDNFVNYLDELSTTGDGILNTKQVISGMTIDVIASTAFATELNSINQSSPFVLNGLGLFNFPAFKVLCMTAFPRWLNNLLGVRHGFRDANFNFFVDLTRAIVRQRKAAQGGGAKREDLVQLLVDAYVYESDLKETSYEKLAANMEIDESTPTTQQVPSTKTKRTLTENEIIAQCIFMFIAGFETLASTLTHAVFELTQNESVQDRMYEEINEKLEGLEVDSEEYCNTVMNEMPFLDAVIKETLRKYPPVQRLERVCSTNNYNLGGTIINKGGLVEVSSVAVHRNPQYYPEPERFNPERFMPQSKHLLVPYAFIPFGQGPRNCLGMRFAYQEMRLCLAKVAGLFKFFPTPQTPKKLKFTPFKPLLNVEPFSVRVEKR